MVKEKVSLPEYLRSTQNMIVRAFPNGLGEGDYFPLIAAVYDEMSHRNIAEVVSVVSGKSSAEVLNDIYKVGSQKGIDNHVEVPREELERVKNLLVPHGYDEWLAEE
jgi:hypothetical protein